MYSPRFVGRREDSGASSCLSSSEAAAAVSPSLLSGFLGSGKDLKVKREVMLRLGGRLMPAPQEWIFGDMLKNSDFISPAKGRGGDGRAGDASSLPTSPKCQKFAFPL